MSANLIVMNCAVWYCKVLCKPGAKREMKFKSLPRSVVAQAVIWVLLLSLVPGYSKLLPVHIQNPDNMVSLGIAC